MTYKVKLDMFEGPFDLLVYLIETAKMNIYDIPVAQITKQYLDYLDRMEQADAAVTGEFMVLAASLIELKSKMLLPRSSFQGEEDSEEDPRTELVQKLLEYKKCKAQAEFLLQCEERALLRYTKPQEDLSIYTREPDEILTMDLEQFIRAFCAFLEKRRRLEDVERRYTMEKRRRMSVETRIDQIKCRLQVGKELRFEELLEEDADAECVVLTFLSLLELVRQKQILVKQRMNFGEIRIMAEPPENYKETEEMQNE